MSSVSAPARRAARPNMRPALVVVGLAVLIVLVGSVLALAGGSPAHPGTSAGPGTAVPGSKLRAEPAAALLAHVESGGEPPADVVRSLAVPRGSTYVSKTNMDRGLGPFDRGVSVLVPAPETEVKTFYLRLLSERRWVVESLTVPSPGATEIIAQRAGSDGYEWRVGLVLRSVRVLVSPALGGSAASAARTKVDLELYQVEGAS